TLRQAATVLAADFGFREAVNSGDVETIQSALENHGARIGATVTALLDTNLAIKAVGEGQVTATQHPLLAQLVVPLSRHPEGHQIALVGNEPYQFVMVQMKAPVLVGWVLMGFPISKRLVEDMRALSDVHLALYSQDEHGARRVLLSTLPNDALRQLESRGIE